MLRMKAVDDNPNHPANRKTRGGRQINPNAVMAVSLNGEPLVYEEYSDDE